ncbi:hypothetical protein LEP1GSC199_0657 [Leptospira vanthielii serovar Holland str. Waz Holland = ATCC 700522]|uniref:Uncharacterized protein n=1 Tax=Leptospira vanthielii serovar Holland str. Waz Holland = ATCC 700522 TaxID=1218591 RepID=N1VYD2_9LEPT|nr:hypothetical protein LEP1GSC199_0657 [Leptospira vanthielii serovar Holland str. Waz Holland = ATCC 700522]
MIKERGTPFFGQVPHGFPHDKFNIKMRKARFMNFFIFYIFLRQLRLTN